MSNGFQTTVNTVPAVGVAGDFCDVNPVYAALAGPGGLVAGPNGLYVGRAAWLSYQGIDADGAPAWANNYGSGPIAGIVPRLQQGLITQYLQDASMLIPAGFQCEVMSAGGFWVKNDGAAQAVPGMKAYANFVDGKFTFAATGAPTTASATVSAIAAGTAATGTGTIDNNVLTIASVSNTIFAGALVTGTGVATGTQIVGQITPLISGEALGGAGRYTVDIPEQTVASTALTITPYVLDTTGGTVTGTIVTGSVIASAGTPTGGVVVGKSVTATYAAGKYVIASKGATSASATVTLASNVETSWYVRSSALAGELVKISNLPALG